MSLVDHPFIQASLDISSTLMESENYTSVQCRLCVKIVFTGTMQNVSLFSDDFYSEGTLIFSNSHEIAYGHVCYASCVWFPMFLMSV
jgi:hypothetical protein